MCWGGGHHGFLIHMKNESFVNNHWMIIPFQFEIRFNQVGPSNDQACSFWIFFYSFSPRDQCYNCPVVVAILDVWSTCKLSTVKWTINDHSCTVWIQLCLGGGGNLGFLIGKKNNVLSKNIPGIIHTKSNFKLLSSLWIIECQGSVNQIDSLALTPMFNSELAPKSHFLMKSNTD